MDYVEGEPAEKLNSSSWARGIEQNYALYGIDVRIVRDDTIDLSAVPAASGPKMNAFEYAVLQKYYYDVQGEEYLLVELSI